MTDKDRVCMQGHKPSTKCGGRPVQGAWGTEVPQWGPGAKPSPPEAEAILMDLILYA